LYPGPAGRNVIDVAISGSSGRQGATYSAALASAEFRAVFSAAGLSVCGNVAADVAQTVLIFDRTSSPLLASLAFALGFLPYLVTGTMLSGLVDRVPPRRLIMTGYLIAAALTAVMALPGMPVAVLLALVFAAGFANGLGGASRGALVRATVAPSAYVPAQSLMRISSQVAQVAANPLGGFLVVLTSARGTFGVAAGMLVLAAAIARLGIRPGTGTRADARGRAGADLAAAIAAADGVPAAGGNGTDPARAGVLGDSLRGMREVLARPALRRLLILGWVIPLFSVAPESLAAPYISAHGGSAVLVGWWLTALPVGIVAGDILGVWLIPPAWQRRLVGAAGLVSFLPYLLFFASPPAYICIPLLVLSGLCSMYSLGLDARVRAACPENLFARMMAVNNAGMMTIQALGFSLAGLIGGLTSPGIAVGVAGGAGIASVIVLWPRSSPQEPGGRQPRSVVGNEREPGAVQARS
jgi:predicted MFS family arabinose efflux permease